MKKILTLVTIFFLVSPSIVLGETPEEKGRRISIEADRRDNGWGDSQSDLTMILKNRHGDESKRIMRGKSLEVAGDGDKTITIFDTPRDVKGTAFLTFPSPTRRAMTISGSTCRS